MKPTGDRYTLREPPAAFGRLCVETSLPAVVSVSNAPAAFGRLCVETIVQTFELIRNGQPPSGGCVLKRL